MSRRFSIIALMCLLSLTSSFTIAESLALTIISKAGQEKGTVIIKLNTTLAPNHVVRSKQLTNDGLYNGVAFHRVIANFMAQTGDVEFGNKSNFKDSLAGSGGSTYDDLKAEFSEVPFEEGVVGMARSRYIHSANSQFFIMTDTQSGLNGQYTVIGKVVAGMDIVKKIKQGASAQNGKVADPDFIKEAVILP
jgi:cyclophilin family peptidyl-prolyl cis-trans isomerase